MSFNLSYLNKKINKMANRYKNFRKYKTEKIKIYNLRNKLKKKYQKNNKLWQIGNRLNEASMNKTYH